MLFVVATRDSTLREYNRNERKRNLLNTRKQYTYYNIIISDSFLLEFLVLLGISQYLRCLNKVNKLTLILHYFFILRYLVQFVYSITFTQMISLFYVMLHNVWQIKIPFFCLHFYIRHHVINDTLLSLSFWNKKFTQNKSETYLFLWKSIWFLPFGIV